MTQLRSPPCVSIDRPYWSLAIKLAQQWQRPTYPRWPTVPLGRRHSAGQNLPLQAVNAGNTIAPLTNPENALLHESIKENTMPNKASKSEHYSLAATAISLCFFLLGIGAGIACSLLVLL